MRTHTHSPCHSLPSCHSSSLILRVCERLAVHARVQARTQVCASRPITRVSATPAQPPSPASTSEHSHADGLQQPRVENMLCTDAGTYALAGALGVPMRSARALLNNHEGALHGLTVGQLLSKCSAIKVALGLGMAEVLTLASRQPAVLRSAAAPAALSAQVRQMAASLGLPAHVFAGLVARQPELLEVSPPERLAARAEALASVLGLKQQIYRVPSKVQPARIPQQQQQQQQTCQYRSATTHHQQQQQTRQYRSATTHPQQYHQQQQQQQQQPQQPLSAHRPPTQSRGSTHISTTQSTPSTDPNAKNSAANHITTSPRTPHTTNYTNTTNIDAANQITTSPHTKHNSARTPHTSLSASLLHLTSPTETHTPSDAPTHTHSHTPLTSLTPPPPRLHTHQPSDTPTYTPLKTFAPSSPRLHTHPRVHTPVLSPPSHLHSPKTKNSAQSLSDIAARSHTAHSAHSLSHHSRSPHDSDPQAQLKPASPWDPGLLDSEGGERQQSMQAEKKQVMLHEAQEGMHLVGEYSEEIAAWVGVQKRAARAEAAANTRHAGLAVMARLPATEFFMLVALPPAALSRRLLQLEEVLVSQHSQQRTPHTSHLPHSSPYTNDSPRSPFPQNSPLSSSRHRSDDYSPSSHFERHRTDSSVASPYERQQANQAARRVKQGVREDVWGEYVRGLHAMSKDGGDEGVGGVSDVSSNSGNSNSSNVTGGSSSATNVSTQQQAHSVLSQAHSNPTHQTHSNPTHQAHNAPSQAHDNRTAHSNPNQAHSTPDLPLLASLYGAPQWVVGPVSASSSRNGLPASARGSRNDVPASSNSSRSNDSAPSDSRSSSKDSDLFASSSSIGTRDNRSNSSNRSVDKNGSGVRDRRVGVGMSESQALLAAVSGAEDRLEREEEREDWLGASVNRSNRKSDSSSAQDSDSSGNSSQGGDKNSRNSNSQNRREGLQPAYGVLDVRAIAASCPALLVAPLGEVKASWRALNALLSTHSKPAQRCALITRDPGVLLVSPRSLVSALECLRYDLGMTASQAASSVLQQPALLKRDPVTVLAQIRELSTALAMPESSVKHCLVRCPSLLSHEPASVKSKAEALQQMLGVSGEQVTQVLIRTPALLTHSPRTLSHKMDRLTALFASVVPTILDTTLRSSTTTNNNSSINSSSSSSWSVLPTNDKQNVDHSESSTVTHNPSTDPPFHLSLFTESNHTPSSHSSNTSDTTTQADLAAKSATEIDLAAAKSPTQETDLAAWLVLSEPQLLAQSPASLEGKVVGMAHTLSMTILQAKQAVVACPTLLALPSQQLQQRVQQLAWVIEGKLEQELHRMHKAQAAAQPSPSPSVPQQARVQQRQASAQAQAVWHATTTLIKHRPEVLLDCDDRALEQVVHTLLTSATSRPKRRRTQ